MPPASEARAGIVCTTAVRCAHRRRRRVALTVALAVGLLAGCPAGGTPAATGGRAAPPVT